MSFEIKIVRDLTNFLAGISRMFVLEREALLKMSTTIVPIVDVHHVTKACKFVEMDSLNLDIAGNSVVTDTTKGVVPQGHRWTLLCAFRSDTAGTSCIGVTKVDGKTMWLSDWDTTGCVVDGFGIQMEAGDYIGMKATDNAGDTSEWCRFAYLDEVITN